MAKEEISPIARTAGKRLKSLLSRNDKDATWLEEWLNSKGMGRDRNTIYRWQTGRITLPPEFAYAIGQHFGVDPSWFYGDQLSSRPVLIVRKAGRILVEVTMDSDVSVEVRSGGL